MEHSRVTQRHEIRLLMRQGRRLCEIVRQLHQDHGNCAPSQTTMHRWMTAIRGGRADVSSPKPTGRPTKVTPEVLQTIKDILADDKTTPICVLAHRTGLAKSTIHRALRTILKLKKRPAKWVLHQLTQRNKNNRMRMCRRLLGQFTRSPTMSGRVITGDESWFHAYEPATKMSSSAWLETNEVRPTKARQPRYGTKIMLLVFWDAKGIVLREFVPNGVGINAQFYARFMRHLREAIRCKCPHLWRRNHFWLHHDNAPTHRSVLVQNLLTQTNTHMVEQAPYSPDLAPSDFFLFNWLKKHMRGERFPDVEALMERIDEEIGMVAQWEFEHAMTQSWPKRLRACLRQRGDFFE